MVQAFSDRIQEDYAGERLDVFATRTHGGSRTHWQRAAQTGTLKVNDQPTTASRRLQAGDVVDYFPQPPVSARVTAIKVPPILYEDDDVLVVDKPAGLVVYPPAGSTQPSLVQALAAKIRERGVRAGVVHRLDKDTSGVLIMAKSRLAREFLMTQFKNRQVRKVYLALVTGHMPHAAARIELPLARRRRDWRTVQVDPAGKPAALEYETKQQWHSYSLLRIRLETGRTHQIRVQLSHLGHPVAGDVVYGSKQRPSGLTRQFLHAESLSLQLPSGIQRTFRSKLPSALTQFLDTLA